MKERLACRGRGKMGKNVVEQEVPEMLGMLGILEICRDRVMVEQGIRAGMVDRVRSFVANDGQLLGVE